jgi:hypothetical protein
MAEQRPLASQADMKHFDAIIIGTGQEVHTYHAGGASATLGESDILEDPKLLPGFTLPTRNLFDYGANRE